MDFSYVTMYYLLALLQWVGSLLLWIVGGQLMFTTIGIIYTNLKIKMSARVEPEMKKVVVITGATAGFGLLLTKHFYKLGFSVVAGYFNEQETGFKELSELRGDRVDVRNQESIETFGEKVRAFLGENNLKLFSLINNAGIGNAGAYEWMSTQSISDVLDTNLKGTMQVSREFMRDIIENQGRIVNVSSCTFLYPGRGISAYGTTKAGVTSFSELLDEDLRLHGASCCCVMAGNFISVSDIVYSLYRSVKNSTKLLEDDLKLLFEKSIREQNEIVEKLLRKKLEAEKREVAEIEAQYGIDLTDFDVAKKRESFIERIKDCLWKLLAPMDGRSESLGSSNLAQVFELAVCSKSPTSRLYAGNPLYTHVLGPSMEFMAPSSRTQLKPLINELIFRV